MKNKKTEKILIVVCSIIIIIGTIIMFGSNPFSGNKTTSNTTQMPEASAITSEIIHGISVEQTFICKKDNLIEVAIVFNRAHFIEKEEDQEETYLIIEVLDGETVLAKEVVVANEVQDQHRTYLKPEIAISGVKDKELTLKIYSNTQSCSGIRIMMQENDKNIFKYGEMTVKGTLCFTVTCE